MGPLSAISPENDPADESHKASYVETGTISPVFDVNQYTIGKIPQLLCLNYPPIADELSYFSWKYFFHPALTSGLKSLIAIMDPVCKSHTRLSIYLPHAISRL
jgi:hypothetical protein